MELSIITVSFNNSGNIRKTLDSLIKYRPTFCEIIVVDNASTDGTAEIVQTYSQVKLVQPGVNQGFAKSCNLGAKNSQAEWLLFLNPDTELIDDSVERMLQSIKSDTSIGIIAPKLILSDGSVQPSVTKLPTLWGVIREHIFGVKNVYSQYVPKGEGATEVEGVYGAAMMINHTIFKKVNGFNERYFLYFEDLDLCRKLRKSGLKIIYNPTFQFKHDVGSSTKNIDKQKLPKIQRILANFWPIRSVGANYYQIVSGNIYHGVVMAFLIRLVTYIGVKSRR